MGEGDIFIAKYDPSGNLSWINVTGGKADDGGFAICLDKFGYCYITGGYQSSGVNFETTILPWRGSLDIFVAKYDSDGNFYWANCAGGSWVDWAKGITTDFSGNIYIIGTIENKAVFGNDTLSYYGASDVFFAKLNNGDNGIEPGTPGNTILAYPNPFSTFTKLSFQTKGSEKFTLSIYNSMGQIIKQEDFFRSPILIYKQNLNPGLYFFQVKNSAGIAGQGKLIIE